MSLPEAERVLVLAPHPDDEALGCGGTIALYVSGGREVRVVVVSDGGGISPSGPQDTGIDIVEKRRREAIASSEILGISHVYFLDLPDGDIGSHKKKLLEKISDIVTEFRPDIIFSPSPIDYHNDHMAVSAVTFELLKEIHGMRVAFYEIYETFRFNCLIDISGVLEIKKKAIMEYQSSLFNVPEIFFQAITGLNRFRSLHTREDRHYEAFWVVSGPVEKNDMLTWLTYGVKEEDAATVLLSNMRTIDKLLFEIRKSEDILAAKEQEVQALNAVIGTKETEAAELRMRLEDMTRSLGWRFVSGFYGIRDKMLPEGSAMRKLYDGVISRLKSRGPSGNS